MKAIFKMKSEETVIKDFKAVEFMRRVRNKISNDIKDMTFEQIERYFEERRKIKLSTK